MMRFTCSQNHTFEASEQDVVNGMVSCPKCGWLMRQDEAQSQGDQETSVVEEPTSDE